MQYLQALETQELTDLLAYMKVIAKEVAKKYRETIQQYDYDIAVIQTELNSRQQTNANTGISETDTEFMPEDNLFS